MESGTRKQAATVTTGVEAGEATGVVLLGGTHGALSMARSLGRAGVPVVLVTDDHPLPGLSRYVGRGFSWPGASSPRAAAWLLDFAAEHGLRDWLLIPCADAEVRYVAEHLPRLRTVFRVFGCDWNVLQAVCDKQQLAETAAAAGVSRPRSYRIRSQDEAMRVEALFPVVLKPAMRMERNAFTSAKAWRADSRDQLVLLYREAAALVGADNVVVQELVPGGGEAQFSYVALWHDGGPVAEMVARRTRQYPLEFSFTSTFVEVVDNPTVMDEGRRLLSAVGFDGLVEVEFKFDARDGRYKVLDVNPRAWSWIALCADAGLDLPVLLRDTVRGKAIAPAAARPGHAWIHVSRDIVAAAQLVGRGDLTVRGYVASLRQTLTFASFAWDDPLPGLLELPLTVTRVIRRAWSSAVTPDIGLE